MNKTNNIFLLASAASWIIFSAQAADIDMNTAHMQAMDKITGRVSEIDVPVNGLVNFGTFSILVRRCVSKSPEETPENTAFVDIVDNYQSENPINVFKGWMFSSTPALNAVEHPIYDIWLLNCYNRKNENTTLLTQEQLDLRDTLPMSRPEKAKTDIRLTIVDQPVEDNEPQTLANELGGPSDKLNNTSPQIINIDVDTNISNEAPAAEETDFASEGEEIIEAEIPENDITSSEEYETITITE